MGDEATAVSRPRMTLNKLLILRAVLDSPTGEVYGNELVSATGLSTGTVFPILFTLERAGWLTSRTEDIDPVAQGRPRRRYYRLTEQGSDEAGAALARTAVQLTRPKIRGASNA